MKLKRRNLHLSDDAKADTLKSIYERIASHPKDGMLITMQCGKEDRFLLLQAIRNEHARCTAS